MPDVDLGRTVKPPCPAIAPFRVHGRRPGSHAASRPVLSQKCHTAGCCSAKHSLRLISDETRLRVDGAPDDRALSSAQGHVFARRWPMTEPLYSGTRPAWRNGSAYDALRRIDRAGLMWEWLRRDEDYIAWYARASAATRATEAPSRWGLHFRRRPASPGSSGQGDLERCLGSCDSDGGCRAGPWSGEGSHRVGRARPLADDRCRQRGKRACAALRWLASCPARCCRRSAQRARCSLAPVSDRWSYNGRRTDPAAKKVSGALPSAPLSFRPVSP